MRFIIDALVGIPPYRSAAKELWERTKTDWHVTVHHTITEPVCAVVSIYSDDHTLPSVEIVGGYDVNAAIEKACEAVLAKLPDRRAA